MDHVTMTAIGTIDIDVLHLQPVLLEITDNTTTNGQLTDH